MEFKCPHCKRVIESKYKIDGLIMKKGTFEVNCPFAQCQLPFIVEIDFKQKFVKIRKEVPEYIL